jgi:hypothetical protein
MMDDSFIDNVITPKPQSKEEAIMNREFYGMEAVTNSAETEHDEQDSGQGGEQ